jgi:arylformamidase
VRKYIDVSVDISPDLPIWPGSPEIRLDKQLDLDRGDIATDTTLCFSVHTGTHVDAPVHFISGGSSVDQLSLDILIGETYLATLSDDVNAITPKVLDDLGIPSQTERLLLKTSNSRLWELKKSEFQPDFVGLTDCGAQWIVDRKIKLVGIDYLSVQRFYDGPETHQILLGSSIIIIEGLNLTSVVTGFYEMLCLPIKLKGVEGAPARVLLRSLSE